MFETRSARLSSRLHASFDSVNNMRRRPAGAARARGGHCTWWVRTHCVMGTDSYDLIIIGGGSGGSSSAKRAAEYGAKVVIIERGATFDADGVRHGAGNGGTCVNVGCVPKKLMYMAAQQREAMHGSVAIAAGYGLSVPPSAANFDWAGVKSRRDAYVQRLTKTYKGGWEKAGCEVLHGLASFDSATRVTVELNEGGSRSLTAPKILVACGGRPSTLPIPGAEHGITSDGFFDLEVQPKKAVVLGAGYIAVELAGILHGLGTETHLCFRGETVLRRGFDKFIVETLMGHMSEHGPILKPGATPARVDIDPQTRLKTVVFEDGSSISGVDCVLFATGRTPVTDLLRMENTGVALSRGYIVVDEKEATNVPGRLKIVAHIACSQRIHLDNVRMRLVATADTGIFAIGDVTTTGYELTPVAIAAGRRLADRLFGGEPNTGIVYDTIATVLFSHPAIGTIGLTEEQALKTFGQSAVKTKYSRFASMLYAFNAPENKVKTALKLVLKLPEERVVGLHCIGPFSDEMLQGFAVAVRMGATRMDFEASVAIHPTISEEFVTFGGWGQSKDKDPNTGAEVGDARPCEFFASLPSHSNTIIGTLRVVVATGFTAKAIEPS